MYKREDIRPSCIIVVKLHLMSNVSSHVKFRAIAPTASRQCQPSQFCQMYPFQRPHLRCIYVQTSAMQRKKIKSQQPSFLRVEVIQAESHPGAAVLSRVARASEAALRVRHVSAGRPARAADQVERVAAPALRPVLDSGVLVHVALAQTPLHCHICRRLQLELQQPARRRFRHASVVGEVGIARRYHGSRRCRCGRG